MSIEQRVKQAVLTVLDGDDTISTTASFEELGADSLSAIEIVLAVESEFDYEFPDDIAPPKNIQEVIDYITALDI